MQAAAGRLYNPAVPSLKWYENVGLHGRDQVTYSLERVCELDLVSNNMNEPEPKEITASRSVTKWCTKYVPVP